MSSAVGSILPEWFARLVLVALLGVATTAPGLFGTAPAAAHETGLTPHGTPYVYLSARDRSIAASWGEPNEYHNPPTRDHGSAVTNHKIWYRESTSSTWTSKTTGSADRNYTITGLSNGKTYDVRSQAINANGGGGLSYTYSIYLPTSKPLAPTSVSGTAGDSSAALSWTFSNTSGSAITKWEYRRQTAGSNNWSSWKDICETTETNRGCPGTRSHTAAGLTNGTSYTFQVRGKNHLGYGPESSSSAAVTPVGPPAKPTGLTATAGNGSAALTWTAGSNGGSAITGWKYIKHSNNAWDGDWTAVPNSGADTTSYTVPNLTNGTAYKFKVRAVNANGDGAESSESGEVTPSASAPVTLTASGVTATTAKLTIANWSKAWSFKGNHISCTNVAAGTSEVDLSGLKLGWDYLVDAYGAHNCPLTGNPSPKLDSVIFTMLLRKVEGVSVTAGAGSLSIGWTAQSYFPGSTGYHVQWKSETQDWSSDRQSDASTNSATISSLTEGATYSVRVRSYHRGYMNRVKYGEWSDTATAAAPTLAASGVTHDSATLTIANHGGDWHYKANAAPDASCSTTAVSGTTKDLTGLSGNTSYTYKAYSDSGCTSGNLLATASAFLTKPGKPAKPTATAGAGSGKLTLASSVTGGGTISNWQYTKDNGANWTDIDVTSTTLSYVVENLTDGTDYSFKVRAVNATGTGPDSDASDAASPANETLTVSNVTKNGATLTIGNHPGNWHYKHASGNCSSEQTGTTASVTGLAANTSYTFTAYSDRCTTAVATAPAFPTLPPKPAKPAAAPGAGGGKLTLASSVTGDADLIRWEYKKKEVNGNFDQDWTSVTTTSGTLSHVVSDLTNGTNYVFKVRAVNASGDGAESDESDAAAPLSSSQSNTPVTPPDVTLAASGVTHDSATLTIANHSGGWHYKANAAPDASCSSNAVTTSTVDLTNLSGNTSYTYKAYSDSGCTSGNLLATASAFLTKPGKPAKPTATAGAGSGKLTLASSVTGGGAISNWQYTKDNGANWTDIDVASATLSYVVENLTDGTDYAFKVRAKNATGTGPDSDASDAAAPADETLAASGVTHDSATLTIANHGGDWHYKANAAPDASCSTTAVSGTTKDLTGLSGNTSYTYKAYSDSGCTSGNLLATASAFLTKPGKPAKPTATAGAGSGKLTLASSVTGGGTISNWQYTKDDGANWTDIDVTSTTLSYVVENLTDGTDYAFKVRAVNATGTGPDSDASDSAAPADETLAASGVTHDSATLTIGNHSGNWHYRYASPDGGDCSPAQAGAAANLTGLTPGTNYVFKAYGDVDCSTELAAAPPFLTRPARTTGVTVGSGDGRLQVSWTAVKSATGYKVQWKSGDENYDASRQATAADAEHAITGLTNATAYSLRVAAVNATGDGAWSDETAGTPSAGPTAAAPLAPSTPDAAAGDASVALSWTPGGDGGSAITKWQYQRKAGSGGYGAWTDMPGSGASTTTHTVTGLTNGVAYRFRVRAVNTIGAGAPSPESDVAVPAAPAASPTGWLARFGRAAGSQAVEMLTGRMNAPAPGGSRMTLGGRSVDLNEDIERLLAKQGGASGGLARWGTADGSGWDEATGTYHETTVSELLRGGSFHLASAQEAEAAPGGRWSMWGRGARTSFEGASAVEGDVTTAMLGMDYEKGGVLMGVALSHARGEGGFGKAGMEAALTSAHPYLRFALNERISAWGVLGMGRGEMTLEEKGRKIETDLEMRMGAFGVRGELMRVGGFDLAVKSDALLAQVDADAADGLDAVSAESTRLRVMLEASRAVTMKDGGRFTPSVEAGLRHDGGDADEGLGVEVGGGLRFTNSAWGLTLELRARGLITHEGEDAADWGAGGTLRIAPGEAGRGLALTVEPAVGETAGGIARLWSVEDASRLAREEVRDIDPRVRAEVGYGLDAWGGLLTPYAGLSASEDGGAYRLGGRFRVGESLSMSVEGGVREREDADPVHGVALRGSLRW